MSNQSAGPREAPLFAHDVSPPRVAAVQMHCRPRDPAGNREHAESFVVEAARLGAGLIVLPELMPSGYVLDRSAWRCAEPLAGPTVQWMRALALRHRVGLGCSLLTTDGRDFHNSFVLVDDHGEVIAVKRKSRPAAHEAFLFRGVHDDPVVQTRWGRVGIGICYEALRSDWGRRVQGRVDFVILSLAAPSPTVDRHNTEADRQAFDQLIRHEAEAVAHALGVPCVLANQGGSWSASLPWPFLPQESSFPGGTAIVDARGVALAQVQEDEGLAVATLPKPADIVSKPIPPRWLVDVPWKFNLFVIPETVGSAVYRLSRERRRMAAEAWSTP